MAHSRNELAFATRQYNHVEQLGHPLQPPAVEVDIRQLPARPVAAPDRDQLKRGVVVSPASLA